MRSNERMLQNNLHFCILQVLLVIKSQNGLKKKGNIYKKNRFCIIELNFVLVVSLHKKKKKTFKGFQDCFVL